MNRIQNQINAAKAETETQKALREAKERQDKKEKSGNYRLITICKRTKLHLLCRVDKNGKLLPQEKLRIKEIRQTLGIKGNE